MMYERNILAYLIRPTNLLVVLKKFKFKFKFFPNAIHFPTITSSSCLPICTFFFQFKNERRENKWQHTYNNWRPKALGGR